MVSLILQVIEVLIVAWDFLHRARMPRRFDYLLSTDSGDRLVLLVWI